MKPWLYGTAALPPMMRGCLAPPFEPLAAGGIGRAALPPVGSASVAGPRVQGVEGLKRTCQQGARRSWDSYRVISGARSVPARHGGVGLLLFRLPDPASGATGSSPTPTRSIAWVLSLCERRRRTK